MGQFAARLIRHNSLRFVYLFKIIMLTVDIFDVEFINCFVVQFSNNKL